MLLLRCDCQRRHQLCKLFWPFVFAPPIAATIYAAAAAGGQRGVDSEQANWPFASPIHLAARIWLSLQVWPFSSSSRVELEKDKMDEEANHWQARGSTVYHTHSLTHSLACSTRTTTSQHSSTFATDLALH